MRTPAPRRPLSEETCKLLDWKVRRPERHFRDSGWVLQCRYWIKEGIDKWLYQEVTIIVEWVKSGTQEICVVCEKIDGDTWGCEYWWFCQQLIENNRIKVKPKN